MSNQYIKKQKKNINQRQSYVNFKKCTYLGTFFSRVPKWEQNFRYPLYSFDKCNQADGHWIFKKEFFEPLTMAVLAAYQFRDMYPKKEHVKIQAR